MDFAAPKVTQHSATNYSVSYGDDKSVYAEFSMEPVHLTYKSEQEGRYIAEDRAFITIIFPGDRTKQIKREVRMEATATEPSDPQRFPRQWEQFQNQREQVAEGTPITDWPPLSKSQALELKGYKIHTVEHLSSLPDTALTFLGARELREKAKNWLDVAKTGGISSKIVAELEQLKADNQVLRQQINDINAATLEETSSPRRGRPPKNEE